MIPTIRRRLRRVVLALTGQQDDAPERFMVRGFDVVVANGRPDISTSDVIARLEASLALLEQYAAPRVAHLRRDIKRIRVERYACRGAFLPAERAVLTELTFLARRDIGPEVVAASILHEGVHARIAAFTGASYQDPPREERICRRAELRFGRSLPPTMGAAVIERAEMSLAMADDEVAPMPDAEEMRRLVADSPKHRS